MGDNVLPCVYLQHIGFVNSREQEVLIVFADWVALGHELDRRAYHTISIKQQFTALSFDAGKSFTLVESYNKGQLKELGDAKISHLQQMASAFSPLGYEPPNCLMLLQNPTDKQVYIFTGDMIEYNDAAGKLRIVMSDYNRYIAEIDREEVSIIVFGDSVQVGPDAAPKVETVGPELVKAFIRVLN